MFAARKHSNSDHLNLVLLSHTYPRTLNSRCTLKPNPVLLAQVALTRMKRENHLHIFKMWTYFSSVPIFELSIECIHIYVLN